MKILINSPTFYPNFGGIETMINLLAEDFKENNNEVIIISNTVNPDKDNFPFKIIRQPGFIEFLKILAWCDLYFLAGMTLKGIWPLIFVPKPLFISHQTWYINPEKNETGWKENLKVFFLQVWR